MKKNVLLLMASTLVCLVACNKETELPNDEPAGRDNDVITEVIGAALEKNETKADISDGLKFSWRNGADRAGDYVAFWNGTTFVRSGASSAANAETTFEITYNGTRSEYAYYPYYIVQDIATEVNGTGKLSAAGTTTVVLPDTYDYAEVSGTNTPCPMIAANTAGNGWAFKQLCGLLRLTVSGIPATANKLVVTFDKVVTGAFDVTGANTTTPYISAGTGTSTVTITLTPADDYCGAVVNIPVPVGDDISVTSVVAKKDGDLVATSITASIVSEWDVARKHGKKATAKFTPSIYSLIFADGNLYTDGSGNLGISPNWYTNMYIHSGAVDDDIDGLSDDLAVNSFGYDNSALYSINNRSYFNWYEMYYLMKGTKPTWAQASTALSSTDVMSKDFSGTTWRVPTADELIGVTRGKEEKTSYTYTPHYRSGARVNNAGPYRYLKILVTDMPVNTGTTGYTSSPSEDFTYQSDFAMRPTTQYQAGLLLFPDNVEITGTFTLIQSKSSYGINYYDNKITMANLENLINQGCAFLPALGRWHTGGSPRNRFDGVGGQCTYYCSTEINDLKMPVLMVSKAPGSFNLCHVGVNESKNHFGPVRLVRDVE